MKTNDALKPDLQNKCDKNIALANMNFKKINANITLKRLKAGTESRELAPSDWFTLSSQQSYQRIGISLHTASRNR
jgi:hypothetical protein